MSLLDKASLIVTPNGFKASKLYSVVPSSGAGDLDVTRATIATRVNSSGLIESVGNNVPRIDYTNGSCPSLLVEPQRTNLLTYSEQFNDSSWLKVLSSINSNVIASPDGSITADKLVEDNTNSNHLVQKVVSASNASYTFSVFAKKAERNWVVLRSVNASFQNVKAWFNIDAGTIGTLENGATAKITNFSNGWYKLEMTIPSYSTGFEFRISPSTGNNIDSYLGDGTSGLYIWGAQLEQASYATSYIPTTTTSVTRNADVISKTGISSLIGQSEGTLFFDGIVNNIQNSATNILNTNKDPLTISTFALGKIKASNKFGFDFFLGNGTYTTINLLSTNAFANGIRTKVAIRYKSGDFAMYVNGNLEATSSSTFTANGSKSELFLNDSVTYFFFQESVSYNSAQLYKTGLSNSELAQLTTI